MNVVRTITIVETEFGLWVVHEVIRSPFGESQHESPELMTAQFPPETTLAEVLHGYLEHRRQVMIKI